MGLDALDTSVDIYEYILKLRHTYATIMKKKSTKASLEKMRESVLRGASGPAKSTLESVLGVLLGTEPLQNNINLRDAKAPDEKRSRSRTSKVELKNVIAERA